MKDSIELKELWNASSTAQASEEAIINKAVVLKNNIRKRASLGILSLVLTMGIIIWVLVSFDFFMWSTKVGIALVISALVLGILNSLKTILTPSTGDDTKSNKDYLEQLLVVKDQQHFTQTILMSTYFALLSVGLILYMYEPASKMPIPFAVIAYGLTIAWIVFNWFYWRPRIIKKQSAQMEDTIAKLREMNDEFAS